MPGPRCTTPVPWLTPTPATLISDAEVAEIAAFTAFGSNRHPVIARRQPDTTHDLGLTDVQRSDPLDDLLVIAGLCEHRTFTPSTTQRR